MAEETKIKGRFEIDADDEGLLAVLHFIPDEQGKLYDKQAINRLISEKQIVYGINRKELDQKIDALFKSPEEINITLAEGDAPENAAAAEHEWTQTEIPEERKADIERLLKNAPPPQIFRTEIEKIRQEKTVKKKGPLLFGKDKEEKVTDIVKREKKIKVDLVPDLVESGWVETGATIALVSSGKPAKPGRDIYGKPVLSLGAAGEFWLGSGIEKKAGRLVAAESGILRRGGNWADILPLKMHDWSLELSKDKNTCLLNFNPGGTELEAPDPAEILKKAEMLGCAPETLFSEARLSEIIDIAISGGKVLSGAVISTDDDGFFEIKISEDRMKAEMVIHKSRGGGEPLVLKQIGAAIKAGGLKGIDLKKVQEIILEFYRGPEADISFLLAEGTAAEKGETGDLVYDLEFMKDSAVEEIKKRAVLLDDEYLGAFKSAEEFPPAEASAAALVKENQQIAEFPASDGKKGLDVYGKEIGSDSDKLSSYKALENVKIDGGKFITVTPGLLERFEKDGITAFRVRPHADAELKVKLSADQMTATMTAYPATGSGAPPSLEDANRQLAEAGVTKGINAEALRSAVDKCRDGEVVSGALIAMGKAAKNAGDMKLKFLIQLASGEAVSIDEKGRANYRKQNRISSIKEGDMIAEIRVVEGNAEDGFDVCGRSITAKQLSPLNLEVGANIKEEKDEKGDTFLIATKSGRVIYENNKLEVQENLNIKGDVDFGSGNIKFGGDVNIKGNVKSGFFVMAGGNIAIGMNSEMSLLTSEKSIIVVQGVKGGGKALLRAKESIQLSFAERATLLAVENITVKNAVFGCKVKCNGRLKLVSEKGYLVGGRIQAREGIEAANIGSLSGSRTEVSFGQDYLISDKIETEEKEINRIKNRLVKIDSEMRDAERGNDRKQLAALRMEKVKLMKILEKRSMRIFTLKERFEQHFPGEVVIRGEVFPGVVFESHGRQLEITKNAKALKIVFNQKTGVLEQIPLTKNTESE